MLTFDLPFFIVREYQLGYEQGVQLEKSAPQDFLKLVEAVKDPLVDEFAKMSLGLLDKTQSDSSHCCYTKE